ncbi:unnamed protein product [Brassicogethes aeneus]|uniref:Uncharacterized protein n=1 Tax=Brassicogethes aeneus TaxID=1431903 RepID=A0A9P0BEN7_BRAAE|nr:unnamed protein product [Brassicogethes aeneus]
MKDIADVPMSDQSLTAEEGTKNKKKLKKKASIKGTTTTDSETEDGVRKIKKKTEGHDEGLVLFVLLLGSVLGLPREIIVDDEGPALKANKLQNIEDEGFDEESPPCFIEYKVMKRLKGSCIKLHEHTQACVAENYLEVAHPQCMYK